MSSHINRLLLSTCLPVMALSLSVMTLPSHAGFEWTPPDEVQELPMPEMPPPPVVRGDALPSGDALPMPESRPQTPQPAADSEAMRMRSRVLRPQEEAPAREQPIAQPAPRQAPNDAYVPPMQPAAPQGASVLPMPDETVTTQAPSAPVHTPDTQPAYVADTPQEPAEDPAIPAQPTDEQIAAPQYLVEDSAPAQEPQTAAPAQGGLTINPFPLQEPQQDTAQTDSAPAPQPEASSYSDDIQWNAPVTYDVIEGFGKDMPLVMAMGQIVPARFAYSFGSGVNPGARVSWEGGKPWNEVLRDVIAPLGLGMRIEGNTLSVFVTGAPAVNIAPQPEPAPAAERTVETVTTTPEPETAPIIQEDASADVPPVILHQDEKSATKALQAAQLERLQGGASGAEAAQNTPAPDEIDSKKNNITHPQAEEVLGQTAIIETAPATLDDIAQENLRAVEVSESDIAAVADATTTGQQDLDILPMPDEAVLTAIEEIPAQQTEIEMVAAQPELPEPVQEPQAEPEIPSLDEVVEVAPTEPTQAQEAITTTPTPPQDNAPQGNQSANTTRIWEAGKGDPLQRTLRKWTRDAGMILVWKTEEDYRLLQNVIISGTIETALNVLFAQGVKNPPKYKIEADLEETRLIIE